MSYSSHDESVMTDGDKKNESKALRTKSERTQTVALVNRTSAESMGDFLVAKDPSSQH